MRLVIAGAGGHGRVVADAAAATGLWDEIVFIDDRFPGLSDAGPWRVTGRLGDLDRAVAAASHLVAAFGDARLRLEVLDRSIAAGISIATIVHPRAVVSPWARLGAGTVVMAGGVVNIGAALGIGCIVNTGATIDHDCQLADGVHICPGAHLSGDVSVGPRTWFGVGAVARQGVHIGSDVTVGAGAVCVSDIRDGVTAVGVPARERIP